MEQTPKVQVPIKSYSLKLSDDQMGLAKKLSKTINEKSYKLPKKDCKKCFGRGFVGYLNGIKSLPVPCRCVYVKPILGKRK